MRDLAPLLLDCVRMKSLCTLQSYPGNRFTRGGGKFTCVGVYVRWSMLSHSTTSRARPLL